MENEPAVLPTLSDQKTVFRAAVDRCNIQRWLLLAAGAANIGAAFLLSSGQTLFLLGSFGVLLFSYSRRLPTFVLLIRAKYFLNANRLVGDQEATVFWDEVVLRLGGLAERIRNQAALIATLLILILFLISYRPEMLPWPLISVTLGLIVLTIQFLPLADQDQS